MVSFMSFKRQVSKKKSTGFLKPVAHKERIYWHKDSGGAADIQITCSSYYDTWG